MTIVNRASHERDFVILSNAILRDHGLSLRAKGLLAIMLSLPETWEYSVDGLCKICKEGRDAIRSTLNELTEAGYLQRGRFQEKDGRFRDASYIINEVPVAVAPAEEFPASGNPTEEESAEKISAEANLPQSNIDISSTEEENTHSSSTDKCHKSGRGAGEQSYRSLASIQEQVNYDDLVAARPFEQKQIDELLNLMQEVYCTSKQTITVERQEYPARFVRERLDRLTFDHIGYVLDCLSENRSRIQPAHMAKYLLTMLFRAPCVAENYTMARVAADLKSSA